MSAWFRKWISHGCLLFCAALPGAAQTLLPAASAIQLNNLGVAHMNRQNTAKAEQLFSEAYRKDHQLLTAQLNQGIALENMQKPAEAEKALQHVATKEPGNVAAWYNLGLVARSNGDQKAAIANFQHVLQLDPDNADAHYLLGSSYADANDTTHAIPQLERALQLNPLHASAEYALARTLMHVGKTDDARRDFARFQQIVDKKIGSPMALAYGDMGPYSLAQSIHENSPQVGPMISVHFAEQPIAGGFLQRDKASDKNAAGGGGCLLDIYGDGRMDLVALDDGANALHIYRNLGDDRFQQIPAKQAGLALSGNALACTTGDFDNDGRTDLAVAMSDRVVLFRNLGNGKFADVTKAVGIHPTNRPAGLTFVDYDHDGDLDLFVTGKPTAKYPHPNTLWRNNGNRTFTDWTTPEGLGGTGETTNAILSDINNDRAVDLVTTGSGTAPTFYANPREGKFRASPLYKDVNLPPSSGIYVFDFNKDGWMDVALTHTGAPGITLWRNGNGKRFQRVPLPIHDATSGWGLTALDFDNDGWIDLAVLVDTAHGPQLRILRNLGNRGFVDVTAKVGLAHLQLDHPRALLTADLDGDGDTDLIVTELGHAPILLRNEGGNRNHWVRLRLRGLADNKSAIGTKVQIFAGRLWQKWEIAGATGYMGQGSPEILAGLGSETHVDIVRMLWPTGVLQDELNIVADKSNTIGEIDRRGSSCPTLFAWNGKKYQFISDVIGAAVVGHWTSPTTTNIPDSGEWIKIDGSKLQPRNGYLSLRFGEPMEEVNYIDQLRLVAIDHPDGTQVYPNERFLSAPPFPRERTIVVNAPHPLVAAWNERGQNVSSLLLDRDRRYVHGFTDLPYDGFANTHTLTLDIGRWTPTHPLRLLLYGYVDYFSATSMYAAWQAGLKPIPPILEAQMPDGSWKRVLNDMGFPAGLPRTITVNLTGKLPAGVHRLRIVTNLQIYWDQILVDNGPDLSNRIRQTELPLALATLEFRGYPEQIEGKSPGDLTYRYDRISATGPFAHERGEYTHYGNVTPLLRKIDNHFAIFGSGDDIDAEFSTASLPPLPAHWRRDYFFYANGYVKDMDFHEASPFSVSQMPFHGMKTYPYSTSQSYPTDPASLRYRLRWNDRFNSGQIPQEYKFNYRPAVSFPIQPRAAQPNASSSTPLRTN